jgi:hypothetical protein
MKKVRLFVVSIALLSFLAMGGCASYLPLGVVYTGTKGAIGAGDSPSSSYTKVGTSESKSILGIVAVGDSSIATAAKNGGIKRIKYVDYEVENILGIYGKYKTIVYGD